MRCNVVRCELDGAATDRIDCAFFKFAWKPVFLPLTGMAGSRKDGVPCRLAWPDTFGGGCPLLDASEAVFLWRQRAPVSIGQDGISGVGTEFGQTLMPILRLLARYWIASDPNDLLAGYDQANIRNEESLEPLPNRVLRVFGLV